MSKKKTATATIPTAAKAVSRKLSLVIPCYNEEKRIHLLVEGLKNFFQQWNDPVEVIAVDDGSSDQTSSLLESNADVKSWMANGKFHLIKLVKNAGKGAALREGIMMATGDYVLTLDADMSTNPLELKNWQKIFPDLFARNEIFIGSRAHKQSKITDVRSRKVVGKVFNVLVRFFTSLHVRDSQCGFKLYPAGIAKNLFSNLLVHGWAHDVEVLYKADWEGIAIHEMPIAWNTVGESKVSVGKDSWRMLWQLLVISFATKWKYLFTRPLKSLFHRKEELISDLAKQAQYRMVFTLCAILLLVLMPVLSFHYGITGDEHYHHDYGIQVYNYIFHGDPSALTSKTGIHYYGGLFDFIVAWCNKWLGWWDDYTMAHFLNSIVGALAILFTGLLAKEIGGWLMGLLALLFIAITPSFFGHAMNNPKDIPFAAANVIAFYFIIRFIKQWPKPTWRTLIFLALSMAAAIDIRVAGLLLIIYTFFFVALHHFFSKEWNQQLRKNFFGTVVKVLKVLIPVSIVAYFAGLTFWPYGRQNPLGNPIHTLGVFEEFFTNIRILFNGQHIWSNQVPWYYIPLWMWVTVPLFVIFGFIASAIILLYPKIKFNRALAFYVCFACVFPVGYAAYKHSILYDGWRHFLFIFPFVAVFAALSWYTLFSLLKNKYARWGASVILIVLFALPLSFTIRNFPNGYVYFNELEGGIKHAYGNFETDYYMSSIRQDCEFIQQEILPKQNSKIILATNCVEPAKWYFRNDTARLKLVYARYDNRDEKDWDYGIFFSRFTNRSQLLNNLWPNTHTIFKVSADGVPLSNVVERKNKSDLLASKDMDEKNYPEAAQLFQMALQYDDKNVDAYNGLAQALLNQNKYDTALVVANSLLKIYPDNEDALSTIASCYMATKQNDKAIAIYNTIIKKEPDYINAYLSLAVAQAQSGQIESAILTLKKAMQQNNNVPQVYYLLGQLYEAKGDKATAQKYFNVVKQMQQQQ